MRGAVFAKGSPSFDILSFHAGVADTGFRWDEFPAQPLPFTCSGIAPRLPGHYLSPA